MKKKKMTKSPARSLNSNENKNELNDYAILLMPFYDRNNNVPKFFDKLLQSKDEAVRFNTSILLLKNKKMVADSILLWFAGRDKWRGNLYTNLEEIKEVNKFPARYKTQLDLARSYLVMDKDYGKVDSIVFVSKFRTSYRAKKGFVYFFKYRVKKEDEWKMGLSGLQPENIREVSSDNNLAVMTDKKLKADLPQDEQFLQQLQRVLFTFHKSAHNFFEGDNNNYRVTKTGDYEER